MRHSTVSAPIESCNASCLSTPGLRFCSVHLLNGQTLYFIVEPKSKAKELYNQTCAHLASQGMLDVDLFGLSIVLDGEYLFVDPDYKLSKYAPKSWRSSSSHGLDSSGKPLLEFHFRVQFYIDSPLLLRLFRDFDRLGKTETFHEVLSTIGVMFCWMLVTQEELKTDYHNRKDDISRRHYYMQLRQNVTSRDQVCAMPEENLYLLAGLALQADYGDFKDTQHAANYFSLPEYFPKQMLAGQENEERLYNNASVVHKANRALSKAQAEAQFIREASARDSFPLAHNTHLYRLKHKKTDPKPGSLFLAICTKGIELYEEQSNKPINGTYYWNNIGKLCFDRKKFEIRSLHSTGERKVFYTSSDEKSKHLLMLCRLTHQFSMTIQPKMAELARKEEEEKKNYREWGSELTAKLSELCYTHRADQRISVISTTSSNTTSGIVSDRVQSLDESEDDLDLEIMINSPPAISIESLAFAHLRDSFRSDRKDILKPSSATTHQSKNDNSDDNSVIPNLSKLTLPATPAPTDISQCSSSCSTVITSRFSHDSKKMADSMNRRQSTSSSFELGFSHGVHNSTLSDSASCLELDYSVRSAHTSSGIYTLQSSCETNTAATTTVACSSETSGICHSMVEDSEGARSRSSIASASGSFHGDGSDPSDTGHGTPLTAEQLSDLIVGRKPHRGKYPSVATVSESLDSIADYVTLPPPPIPPTIQPPIQPMRSTVAEEEMLQRQIQFQHLSASSAQRCVAHLHKSCNSLLEADARIVTTRPINVLRTRSYIPSGNCTPAAYSSYSRNSQVIHEPSQNILVGSNNYLDVRRSGAAFLQHMHKKYPPPPPLFYNRHPPPPPPPRNHYPYPLQVEQYKQQLYSDVDYVVYPMKDPAISKQEYLDSRTLDQYRYVSQTSLNSKYPLFPGARKSHTMYRSTPNVAMTGNCYQPHCQHPNSRYASNQNLSAEFSYYSNSSLAYLSSRYPSSTSPLYSAAASTYSNSMQSLKYDCPSVFARASSDDNILNYGRNLDRRIPPPPPPPLNQDRYKELSRRSHHSKAEDKNVSLDIRSLREKSKNLDLPLISALCNDKSLLKQTNTVDSHPFDDNNPTTSKQVRSNDVKPTVSHNGSKSARVRSTVDSINDVKEARPSLGTSIFDSISDLKGTQSSNHLAFDVTNGPRVRPTNIMDVLIDSKNRPNSMMNLNDISSQPGLGTVDMSKPKSSYSIFDSIKIRKPPDENRRMNFSISRAKKSILGGPVKASVSTAVNTHKISEAKSNPLKLVKVSSSPSKQKYAVSQPSTKDGKSKSKSFSRLNKSYD